MSRSRTRTGDAGGQYLGMKYTHPSPFTVPSYPTSETCIDTVNPGPPYRSGGSLSITKFVAEIQLSDFLYSHTLFFGDRWYEGQFWPGISAPVSGPVAPDMNYWGTLGWKRTLPVSPIMSLAVSLAELREAPRMLAQTKDFMKALGSTPLFSGNKTLGGFKKDGSGSRSAPPGSLNPGSGYLNLQFGWVPIVNDLLNLIDLKSKLAIRLAKVKAQNRKSVRRRVTLKEEASSTLVGDTGPTFSGLNPSLPSPSYASATGGRLQEFEEKSTRIWFVSKYRYFIPELEFAPTSLFGLSRVEQRLLGLSLNAEVIYNLTPWTWLADWFANAGDIVTNATRMAENHVVAEYAYVMCSQELKRKRIGTHTVYVGTGGNERPSKTQSSTSIAGYVTKARSKASPYGFGLNETGFSLYQWSILAALGLSRLR